jgi:hypothetical protein
MANRLASVDLLTHNYRICGQVSISNSGIAGLLNDTTSSYLEINAAQQARIPTYENLNPAPNTVYVLKSNIQAVCLEDREELGPAATRFSKVNFLPVRFTTVEFEFEGFLEWAGRFEFPMIIAEGLNDYLPLYDASVGGILSPSLLIQSPVIVFNRRRISSFLVMTDQL